MLRNAHSRRHLLTLASSPWTLYENEGGEGGSGGGGGTVTVNEHGYPDGKPVAEMDAAHQVAYWKHHARKHEQRANAAPDAATLERLRAADAELTTRKNAELSETQRLQAERDAATAEAATAKAERDAAARKALVLEIASVKGLTAAQAARLQGATKEELEADADALKALFGTGTTQGGGNSGGSDTRSGGNRGGDVGGTKTVSTGADLYRERHGKN
ncbi:hypothetical protein [Streptomyces umbrinus]|uniref:hypothetical protein n=1 Tax=Streptomyces umbrinus TaxID=67370 RepID=UPI0034459FD1